MIEFPITLTSGGSVCLPGHAFALALHYDNGLLTADDIAEVEQLAQAYYDALDAEDKANAEENVNHSF